MYERRMRVRYFLSIWLFVLSGVAFLDRTNISIAGLQISREYGLGNQRLGWIFSAFLIGYAGFQLPAGWLAARFGPRRILTLGVLSWGVATSLTALLPSNIAHAMALLIGLRFALGAGESVIYPAANQFVARWIPMHERGVINGLIFAGVGAGSGLTPPMLNWLITHHGWRAAFWFSAAVGFAAAIVWWLISRDRPEEHPGVDQAELREIRDGMEFHAGAERKGIDWHAIFHRRDLPVLMAGYFSFGYIAWIYFSWFFLYMAQVRHVNLKSSADYAMLPFLSMTVCCLLGGVMSDRMTRRWGLRVGRCGLAAGSLAATAVFLVLGIAGAQCRTGGSDSGRWCGCTLHLAELVLVGLGRYRRAQLRSLLQHGEHGRTDRRGGNGFTDALDCCSLWLDYFFRGGGSAGRFQCRLLADCPSGTTIGCRGFIGTNDRSCQQCVRHSFQFWLIKERKITKICC